MSRIKRTEESGRIPANRLGKIKVGKKVLSSNGNERPTSLDHFRIDAKEPTRSQLLEALNVNSEEEIKTLNIHFLTDNDSQGCFERRELRDSGGRLILYGDGEIYHQYQPATNDWRRIDKNKGNNKEILKQTTDYYVAQGSKGWDESLTLRFVIKELRNIFGYWEFYTKAKKSSIPSIIGPYDTIKKYVAERGIPFELIPFQLTVEKIKGNNQIQIGDKLQTPVFTVVSLNPQLGFTDLEDAARLVQNNVAFASLLDRGKIQNQLQLLEQNKVNQLDSGDVGNNE